MDVADALEIDLYESEDVRHRKRPRSVRFMFNQQAIHRLPIDRLRRLRSSARRSRASRFNCSIRSSS
ncbi:MAG: hypothetical protein MZU97_21885 [Bacillus subtilis]|nr:hypothetical protein [Bacillus subtilis]